MEQPSQRSEQLILGIDEAGYGPNLGPLVIGCSVWLVEDQWAEQAQAIPAAESILERLRPVFQSKPGRFPFTHLPLGDSKTLYSAGSSVDSLAVGVRYWMDRLGSELTCFQDFLALVAPACGDRISRIPWYQSAAHQSPARSSVDRFADLCELVPQSLLNEAQRRTDDVGLRFLGLAATIVEESRFNRDVDRLGNKASLLSQASLALAVDCLKRFAAQRDISTATIRVYCDKHGGRNRYQAMLMAAMPDLWFEARRETATRSDYRTRWQDCDLHWSFLAKGDRLIGSALSSMTAKWIRESLMARLNHYWRSQLPDLKPTAGYPVDAKRFRHAIQSIAERLGYPDSDWWRFR